MTEIASIYNEWMEILILIWIKHQTNNQNIVKISKQFYFLNYEFDKVNSFNSKLCLLVSNPYNWKGKKQRENFEKERKNPLSAVIAVVQEDGSSSWP